MNWAFAFNEFFFNEVRLACNAVLTAIHVGFNVAGVKTCLQQFLYASSVARFGGANEVVVRNVQAIPRLSEQRGNGVGKFLWGNPSGIGSLLNFQAMFVGAGKQMHFFAKQAVPARNGVGHDGGVRVTQVWLGVDVINRGRRAELCHVSTLIV